MKNLFFALAFMLIGTSFATNKTEKTLKFDIENSYSAIKINTADIEFIEVKVSNSLVDTVCMVRDCIIYKGVRYCTEYKVIKCPEPKE